VTGGNDTSDIRRDDISQRRRARNWALFAALMGIAVLVYVVTIVSMGNLSR
jgi:hypothetical protein